MSIDQIELELSRLPHDQQDRIAAYLIQLRSQRMTPKEMTKLEKLRTIEELWADLSNNEEDIDVPDWHITALNETEKDIQAGQVKFVPWDQAKDSIRRQLK